MSTVDRPRVLIKFMDEQYVDTFINEGLLYMNTVQYFREYEDNDPALRGDEKEGLRSSFLPEKISFEINGRVLSDLVGKIEVRDKHQNNTNIYSMTMISENDIKNTSENAFYLSKDFMKFGNKAVFIARNNINIFWDRVSDALNSNTDLFWLDDHVAKRITYVDESEHHSNLGVYTKFLDYVWQYEWRIALKQTSVTGPLILRIGDLSDIVHIIDTETAIKSPIKV